MKRGIQMSKIIKRITILLALSLYLLGCSKLTTASPSSSIEEIIDGVYTITYTDLNSIDPPVIYRILGELKLENGKYTFIKNSEELEHLPVFIKLPMIETPSGTYTLTLWDEYKNLKFDDLPQTESSQNLGTIVFASQDKPYTILLKFSEGQQTIIIDAIEGCIQLWAIDKIIQ